MMISNHLAIARAFERSLSKLDPIADTELYVVFLMRACTNRLNAGLHAIGFTSEVAASGQTGDLNHTYKPKLDSAPPEEFRTVFEQLSYIEELRTEFVRGPRLLTEPEVAVCRAAHADISMRIHKVFERVGRTA